MTLATIYSWIFLTLDVVGRTSPAPLDKIIGAADALNHAIPSHDELQMALGWLMQEGLIVRHGKAYGLTQRGEDLLNEIKSRTTKPFDGWDLLKQKFATATAPIELADVSKAEWQQAYDAYYKRGMEIMKSMGINRIGQ